MSTVSKDEKPLGVLTLDQIVRQALMDIGAGLERYEQFLQWGQDCYRDFKMDISREIKTVEIELTAWKAIEWPNDYMLWSMIGVRKNGRLYVFTNDSEIPLFFDRDDEDAPVANEEFTDNPTIETTDTTYVFRNTNSTGQDEGRLYGLKVKNNGVGYYRINRERREIQLNPVIADAGTAYLEYVASAYNPTSKTIVPVIAGQCHRDYIHWKRIYFSKSATQAEKREAERIYWNEFKRVNERLHSEDTKIADIVEAAIDGYSSTPRF